MIEKVTSPEVIAAVERAFKRVSEELAIHGLRIQATEVNLAYVAHELGLDWHSDDFKRKLESLLDTRLYRYYSSSAARSNIRIRIGAYQDVAIAGLRQR